MQGPRNTKIMFFWDVTSCGLVDRYKHFRETSSFGTQWPRRVADHTAPSSDEGYATM